jgi:hypothetical protein
MKTLASLDLIREKVRNYGIWDFVTWNWFLWDLQKDLMGGNHMTLTMGPWFCNKSCTHGHYAGNGSLWCLKLSEFIWCETQNFSLQLWTVFKCLKNTVTSILQVWEVWEVVKVPTVFILNERIVTETWLRVHCHGQKTKLRNLNSYC